MKYLLSTASGLCLFVFVVSAQNADRSGGVVDANTNLKSIMKGRNMVLTDESETLNITGISGSTFTVSNIGDGTDKSYNHNLRVVLSLTIAENKSEKYQLVFYTNEDKIPFAVASELASFSVYYPISLYETVRTRLEQSLAARKKVQLRIIRKSDGYREGTLIL